MNGYKEHIKDYEYYVKRIYKDSLWMIVVEKQAEEKGSSVDSALYQNARHMNKK
jgi:hypothetical protein